MKFAIHNALENSRYETGDIGTSLERVLRYWTVRDKFRGVHPYLESIGVEKVEVLKDGILFVMNSSK